MMKNSGDTVIARPLVGFDWEILDAEMCLKCAFKWLSS